MKNRALKEPTTKDYWEKFSKEQLIQELQSIHSQFNEAVETFDQNNEVLKKNEELSCQIRKLEGNVDEYQKRLDISLKKNEELEKKINEKTSMIKMDSSAYLSNFDKERKEYKSQISQLQEDLSKQTVLNHKICCERDRIIEQLESLIKASQDKFRRYFASVQELQTFISSMSTEKEHDTVYDMRLEQSENAINQLNCKISKYKKKNKEFKKKISRYEDTIHDLQNQVCQQDVNIENEINKKQILENRHQNEILRVEEELRQQKNSLENENKGLQNKIDHLKSMTQLKNDGERNQRDIEIINSLEIEVTNLKNTIKKMNEKMNDYVSNENEHKKRILSISSSLKRNEMIDETQKQTIAKLQSEIQEISSKYERDLALRQGLELELSSSKERIQSHEIKESHLQSLLQQSALQNGEKDDEISGLKNAIVLIEKRIDDQNSEIIQINNERNNLITLINRVSNAIVQSDLYIQFLERENQNQAENNRKLNQRLSDHQRSQMPKESIPITAWYHQDFPKDLCAIISDFAKNPDLDTSSKLRNVLNSIVKYYNSIRDQCEKSRFEIIKQHSDFDSVMDGLINDVSVSLGIPSISLEEIRNNNLLAKDFVKNVANVQNELNEIGNKNHQNEELILSILNYLGVSKPLEIEEKLQCLLQNVAEQDAIIGDLNDTNKRQKKSLKIFEKDASTQLNEQNSRICSLKDEIVMLKELNQTQLKEIAKLKLSLEASQREIISIDATSKRMLEQEQMNLKDQISEIEKKLLWERENHSQEISLKIGEISRLNVIVSDLERENTKWKKSNNMILNSRKEYEDECKVLLKQCQIEFDQQKDKMLKDKNEMKMSFESAINELRKKNSELASMHQDILLVLDETRSELNDLGKVNSELNEENTELKHKIALEIDEIDRERRVIEMKTKTTLLSKEMAFRKSLEDQKAQFSFEKRKIIGFVAQSFRDYFDSHDELNEANYNCLITRVKKDLERLSSQEHKIRRILGIGKLDSIEEKITNLCLLYYEMK